MVRLEIPSNPYHPNLVYTYISILPTSSEGIKKIWREIPWWPTRVNLSYDIHDFLQHPEKLALNAWYIITASYPIADAGTRNRIEPMRRSGDDEFTVNPSLIKWPHQGLRTPLKHTRKRDSSLWRIEIDVLFSRKSRWISNTTQRGGYWLRSSIWMPSTSGEQHRNILEYIKHHIPQNKYLIIIAHDTTNTPWHYCAPTLAMKHQCNDGSTPQYKKYHKIMTPSHPKPHTNSMP